MDISLRPVTKNDIGQIYEWRNHPSIRNWCFVTKEIDFGEHTKYWHSRLKEKGRFSFMVTCDGKNVGLIRLDKGRGSYEVDILISPESQGRGLGSSALQKTKEIAKNFGIRKLSAKIKPDNVASKKVFEKNGFVERGASKECVLYECEL